MKKLIFTIGLLFSMCVAHAQVVTTIVGVYYFGTSGSYGGDNGPASVARFSISYWANQSADHNNPWGMPLSSCASIANAGEADLTGACVASLTWGIGVAASTGPAAPITWGAATLGGGIVSSIGYGLHVLWSW